LPTFLATAGIRGDAVAAQGLGLNKIVSEDSVRRALKAIDPQAAQSWMHQALQGSVTHALDHAWILDVDTTIKTLYGHQKGAEIGYNPHKPGRPQPRAAHLLGGQPASRQLVFAPTTAQVPNKTKHYTSIEAGQVLVGSP